MDTGYASTDFFATDTAPASDVTPGDFSSYYDTAIPQSYLDGGSAPASNAGNYASIDFFPKPALAPDGVQLIDQRSNSSMTSWGVDQSKIPQSLQNVLGSITEAGAKTGLQIAQSSMNRGTAQAGNVGAFFKNFQSTQTGAQLNAGAYATQIQNFLYNPMVWLGGVILIGFLLFMRK